MNNTKDHPMPWVCLLYNGLKNQLSLFGNWTISFSVFPPYTYILHILGGKIFQKYLVSFHLSILENRNLSHMYTSTCSMQPYTWSLLAHSSKFRACNIPWENLCCTYEIKHIKPMAYKNETKSFKDFGGNFKPNDFDMLCVPYIQLYKNSLH